MAPQVKVHIIHEQELSHADPEDSTGNDSLLLWICTNLQLCDSPCTNIGPICQARASFMTCSFIVQIVCCTKCAVQHSGLDSVTHDLNVVPPPALKELPSKLLRDWLYRLMQCLSLTCLVMRCMQETQHRSTWCKSCVSLCAQWGSCSRQNMYAWFQKLPSSCTHHLRMIFWYLLTQWHALFCACDLVRGRWNMEEAHKIHLQVFQQAQPMIL